MGNGLVLNSAISSIYKWEGTPGRFVLASLVTGIVELDALFILEDDNDDTMGWTGYVAIVIDAIVVFIIWYCMRRRKMKNVLCYHQIGR